jgi:hypothetical protein
MFKKLSDKLKQISMELDIVLQSCEAKDETQKICERILKHRKLLKLLILAFFVTVIGLDIYCFVYSINYVLHMPPTVRIPNIY